MRTIWGRRVASRLRRVAWEPSLFAVHRFRDRRWLSASAAGGILGATGLLISDGPVLMKGTANHQEVWVWGKRESIPGGAEKDLLRPKRIEWFQRHKVGWKQLAFGPSFGAALDNDGCIFVWGISEAKGEDGLDEIFIGPVALDVLGDARGHKFIDVQCSSTHIFSLTARGDTFVFESVADVLKVHSSTAARATGEPLQINGQRMPGLPQPNWWSRLWGGAGVKQMSIGLEHAAFVTKGGQLVCTGGNEWGQCGEPPPKPKQKSMGALEEKLRVETIVPVHVKMPKNAAKIASVVVGGRHTIAMDELGQTFAFGDDRRVQLGLGDTRTAGSDQRNAVGVITTGALGGKSTKLELKRAVTYKYYDAHMQSAPVETIPPPVQNRPSYPPPIMMACGEDFTIAVHRDSPDWYAPSEETNVLFCCGENGEGQCGRNRQNQQQPWQMVRMPKRSKAVEVACGQGHCIARLTSGELWAWGMNWQGEVGCGSRASTCPPRKIVLEDETEKHVVAVACGFRNSGCICDIPSEQKS